MRKPNDAFRDGSNQHPGQPATTVRRHDNQVGFESLGVGGDLAAGISKSDVQIGLLKRGRCESLAKGSFQAYIY